MGQDKPKVAVLGLKGLPAFGGAAAASENVIIRLNDKYDYTIYSIDTHTNKRGQHNGYLQIVFKGWKGKRRNTFIYYFKSLFHVLFIGKYDLIHVNHTSCGFIVPFLRLRYKVVATAHGIVPKHDNKWNRFDKFFFHIFSFLFFRFSNVVASVAKPHIRFFKKYTSKEIHYIPNGISTNNMPENHNEKENYILFAANRIISLKGLHILLEALHILSYKRKLMVVGNMEHTPKYAQKLLKLCEGLQVEFKGLIKDRDELMGYIRKADLFIFPSLNEGMSNMLLEVASMKTPIICSDIEENKAIFNENEVIFFQSGDAVDLAEKINCAVTNVSKLQENAENAYQHLEREYNWQNIASQYDEIYESLLKKRRTDK